MNVMKYINELRVQRQGIDDAIAALSRLAGGQPRRGRPPKWLGSSSRNEFVPTGEVAQRMLGKRRKFSAETRRKMSQAQKKRWKAA